MSCPSTAMPFLAPGLRDSFTHSEPCPSADLDVVENPIVPWTTDPNSPVIMDPFLTIACEETVNAAISSYSSRPFFRMPDDSGNSAFLSRHIDSRFDVAGTYRLECTGSFSPFISVQRSLTRIWQGVPPLFIDVAAEDTGPVIIEVSSVNPHQMGNFSLTLHCPSSPVETIYGELAPATVGTPYYSEYGPYKSKYTWQNIVLSSPYVLAIPLGGAPPWDWEVTGLPDGMVIETPTDVPIAKLSGTPKLGSEGEYHPHFTLKSGGTTLAEGDLYIFVGKALYFNHLDYFSGLWDPVGICDGTLFWYTGPGGFWDGTPGGDPSFWDARGAPVLFGRAYSLDGSGLIFRPYGPVVQVPFYNIVLYGTEAGEKHFAVGFNAGFYESWKRTDSGFLGNYSYEGSNPNTPATITLRDTP